MSFPQLNHLFAVLCLDHICVPFHLRLGPTQLLFSLLLFQSHPLSYPLLQPTCLLPCIGVMLHLHLSHRPRLLLCHALLVVGFSQTFIFRMPSLFLAFDHVFEGVEPRGPLPLQPCASITQTLGQAGSIRSVTAVQRQPTFLDLRASSTVALFSALHAALLHAILSTPSLHIPRPPASHARSSSQMLACATLPAQSSL